MNINKLLILLSSLQKHKDTDVVISVFLENIRKILQISAHKIEPPDNDFDFEIRSKSKTYGKYKIQGKTSEESLTLVKQILPVVGILLENIQIKADYKVKIKKLKNKTKSLKLSEERLNYAFNAVNDAIWDWKYDKGVVYWSPGFLSMLGFKSDEFSPSQNIWNKLLHPDDFSEAEKKFLRCINDPKYNYDHEIRFKTKGKGWKWLHIRGDVVQRDESGKALRIMGVFTDIHSRKLTEENLQESEERYRSTIEAMADYIHVVDEDLKIQLYNRSFLDFMKKTGLNKNIIGKHVLEAFPFLHKRVENQYKWVFENKKTLITEEKTKLKNITYYTQTRKIPIIKNKKVTGIITSMQDITKIKKTEHELRTIIAKLEAMIENTDANIMIADEKGIPVFYNTNYKNKVKEIFGIDMKPGIIPYKNYHDKNAVKFWDSMYEQVLKGERVKQELNISYNNNERYYEYSCIPIIENKKITGFAEHSKEITSIKKYEKELIEAKKKAEESDELKTAFLANMSHEIRTPMNGIIGFAELLLSDNLQNDVQKKYVRIIKNSSSQLLSIINDIIDISKIEAGEININEEEFELTDTCVELFNFHYPSASKKGINLYFDNINDESLYISTDKGKIYQVLNNLIDNARKFTQNGGEIHFGYSIKNENIEFYVKDTGIGIIDKDKDAVFERFIQSKSADQRSIKGTGLGLPISKAYIKNLGGKIWLKSEYGKGTSFYFSIPFKSRQKTTSAKTEEEITENIKKETKTILIVEDDDTNYLLLKEILKKNNAKYARALNGEEAIQVCRKNPDIDLVLMDLKLPKKDGYDATGEIKKIRNDLPVIAQTAYALAGDREKALKAGCDDYIEKPIKENILIKMINSFLNH